MAGKLYRTTIEIWTSYDPSEMEIDTLATEAMDGDAICSIQDSVAVDAEDPSVPEGVISFFGDEERVLDDE